MNIDITQQFIFLGRIIFHDRVTFICNAIIRTKVNIVSFNTLAISIDWHDY